MDPALQFTSLLILFIGLVSSASCGYSPTEYDFQQCERIVKEWKSSTVEEEIQVDKQTLRDLLFFLHVPRTGGRAYFHCFLKKLYSTELECPRSYDKLRFNPGKTNCRLLVTHDDYSMMAKLPRERTSVVTILRDPIDRVFSAYEFSIEVAARFLIHPNLTSATRIIGRIRQKNKGVSTLDIWPWKYLVPWMRDDLFARREARYRKGQEYTESDDSYNMEEIVMPLHLYINDPVTRDVIHNGATFQVAGLTNNSYTVESHDVRRCVQKYQDLDSHVLEVAKKRLNDMLYVGITEDHKESAAMFADVVGSQVISQLTSSSHMKVTNKSDFNFPDSKLNDNHLNDSREKASSFVATDSVNTMNENMTVDDLMEVYEGCITNLRKSQGRRRAASLKKISPANFSKEARRQVPSAILQQIKSLNRLDVELYKHAQYLFAKQHQGMLQKLGNAETPKHTFNGYYYVVSVWKVLLLATSVLLISLVLFSFENSPSLFSVSDFLPYFEVNAEEGGAIDVNGRLLDVCIASDSSHMREHMGPLPRGLDCDNM